MEANTDKYPEGIDHTEDSGFASIAGSSHNDKSDCQIIGPNAFKFTSIPTLEEPSLDLKKIRALKKAEVKRKADEEYNTQKQELMYKRLTHLVSKSKFFSSRILDKFNPTALNSQKKKDENKENYKGKSSRKQPIKLEELDESSSPVKRNKIIKRGKLQNALKNKKKKVIKKPTTKLNLSQDDIEKELNQSSDEEDNDQTEFSEDFALKYFTGELRDYQKKGLKWLIALYENGLNGILADEMGLGKTIQVIALLCYLIEKKQFGPFLIVAPLSTLPNWEAELKRFAPDLPFFVLHGTPEIRKKIVKNMTATATLPDGSQTLPIVLTAYHMVLAERHNLSHYNWRYIVIDEGQRIKNHEAQLSQVLRCFKSISRLILTGTPLQNNFNELWALLNFLMPDIFDDLNVFKSWLDPKELENAKGTERFLQLEKDKNIITSLRQILKPFMLRREKIEVCKDIPAKKEIIVYTPITELQKDLYTAVLKFDYDTIIMKKKQPLIVDVDGVRPKRRCTMRNKFSDDYIDPFTVFNQKKSSFSTINSEQDDNYQVEEKVPDSCKTGDKKNALDTWKNFTNINSKNLDYFIRIRPGYRSMVYRQIINHPYLIHCPLVGGLPQINEDLVNISGKLLVLDLMLKKLHPRGHKVLLFSTMCMVLDILADYLSIRPWKYVMLTGNVKLDERSKAIDQFNNDPEIFIFLITTRAGGIGLNLVAADTVILYDSDWNPQADLQAMARCHRIGQTKPVVVYRFCTKGTIDETVINRGESKRKLEKMVISKDWDLQSKNANLVMELKRLLEFKEYKVVSSENDVFTEAELEVLLDRSDLIPKPN